jgi:hypothetical protein
MPDPDHGREASPLVRGRDLTVWVALDSRKRWEAFWGHLMRFDGHIQNVKMGNISVDWDRFGAGAVPLSPWYDDAKYAFTSHESKPMRLLQ